VTASSRRVLQMRLVVEESQATVETFRTSGPSNEKGAAMLSAS
jgi:hypothetical protein